MNLAPEERVNMSLDDLIKAKRNNKTKKEANKPKPKGKLTVTSPSTTSKNSNKTATKSAAQGKAKRNAAANQRRGLNATGKPTKGEVKKEVKKAVNRVQKKQVKTNQLKSNNIPPAAGLKISFRPAELARTTDRNVQAQILGALSKDPSFKNRGQVVTGQGNRRVQVQATRPVKKKIVVRK